MTDKGMDAFSAVFINCQSGVRWKKSLHGWRNCHSIEIPNAELELELELHENELEFELDLNYVC